MVLKISAARQRATTLVVFAVFAFGALASTVPAGQAGTFVKPDNVLERVAADEFDEEHAHLYEELALTDRDKLVLAALPKGSAYVRYNAPSKCVPAALRAVLDKVSKTYGPIIVNSTYRSKAKNRSVGGKSKSYHLSCRAIDFRVHGRTSGLLAFLGKQKGVGGVKRYRSGFYHIDNGPRRTW